jgi:hypothetical protein
MAFGIPNIERAVSNFLEGGTGITSIRNIEIDKNFLWVVDFVGGGDSFIPPAPFDVLFPASEVTLELAKLELEEQIFGQSSIKYPKRTSAKEFSVTFYDDEKRTLQRWFSDWINLDILNNGEFISGIDDNHQIVTGNDSFGNFGRRVRPSRHIRLALLDAWRRNARVYEYKVVPEGVLSYSGGQGSEATNYTVNFAIVEDLTVRRKPVTSGGFGFDEVKKLIGRFV